jgi:hypothetical protein
MEKRYVGKIDFYVWATSDEEAKKEAKEIAKEIDKKRDNRAALIALGEKAPGIGNYRKIEL